MKKITAFAFLSVLFLLAPHASPAQPTSLVRQKRGSLRELVERVSENLVPSGSDQFRVPTRAQLNKWRSIVKSVFRKRYASAARLIRRHSFPYELVLFTEQANGRRYVLLEEVAARRAGWGLYVFDLETRNPLVLEIPHPISDSNTEFQGIDAFLETRARAFLLAGAHRRANAAESPCTQPETESLEERYAISDVAHSVATVFHVVHETIVREKPQTIAVQLHGMSERRNCPNAFLSSGSATVTTNAGRLLACLRQRQVEAELFDGAASCPLKALNNVQGRFSNGETQNPCRENADSSPAPGKFIHIEQEPALRRNRESWTKVVDALKCAFPA